MKAYTLRTLTVPMMVQATKDHNAFFHTHNSEPESINIIDGTRFWSARFEDSDGRVLVGIFDGARIALYQKDEITLLSSTMIVLEDERMNEFIPVNYKYANVQLK
jgi:hypothetical protein